MSAIDSQQSLMKFGKLMESLIVKIKKEWTHFFGKMVYQVLTLKTKKMNNPFRKDELEQMLEFIKENPQVLNPIGAGGKITSSPLVQYILERLHGLNQNKDE